MPLGAGVGHNGPVDFVVAQSEIGVRGVAITVDFVDHLGERFSLLLRQRRRSPGCDFVAPMGAGVRHPAALAMPFMSDFRLLARQSLVFEASYGGERLGFRRMPVRATSLKVCESVVIIEVQPDGVTTAADDPGVVTNNRGELVAIVRAERGRTVRLDVSPPLARGPYGGTARCHTWTLNAAGMRLAQGEMLFAAECGAIEMRVTRGWEGARGRGIAPVFTRLVRAFRTWPLAYRWQGTLTESRWAGKWKNRG